MESFNALKDSTQLFYAVLATATTFVSIIIYGKSAFSKSTLKFLINIKTVVEDLLLLVFTIAWLVCIASVPYGFLLCWRFCVWLYLKGWYGKYGDLVSGLDAKGTLDDENSKQIIKSLKILKGQVDLEDFRRRVNASVSRRCKETNEFIYPKFHQFLDRCGGFFCWKPSDFDIKYHVRYIDGHDEHSPSMSEADALKLTSEISNDAYEPGRANWEILVIPRFHYDVESPYADNYEPKLGIIIRISHGIGDGYSLMKFILRDMTGNLDAEVPTIKKKKSSIFYGTLVFLYILLKSPRAFYSEMFINDDNPLHNEKTLISGKKSIIWSDPIDVNFLKETKNKLGSGMSTILLSALAGSLRRFMKEEFRAEAVRSLTALMPVPAASHPDNKMLNKFSIVMFPLALLEDSKERCLAIEKEGRAMAQSPDAPLNLFLMNLSGVMPIWFSRFFLRNKQATVVVSNFPGPVEPIAIWGRPLLDNMFWLPSLGESGLSISFLSYTNHMRIGMTVDDGVVPNGTLGARKLINGMVDELFAMGKKAHLPTNGVIRHLVPTMNQQQVTVKGLMEKERETQIGLKIKIPLESSSSLSFESRDKMPSPVQDYVRNSLPMRGIISR